MYYSTLPIWPTLNSAWYVLRRVHMSFLRHLLIYTDKMNTEFEVSIHCFSIISGWFKNNFRTRLSQQ